jgi:hypothetical protein
MSRLPGFIAPSFFAAPSTVFAVGAALVGASYPAATSVSMAGRSYVFLGRGLD